MAYITLDTLYAVFFLYNTSIGLTDFIDVSIRTSARREETNLVGANGKILPLFIHEDILCAGFVSHLMSYTLHFITTAIRRWSKKLTLENKNQTYINIIINIQSDH